MCISNVFLILFLYRQNTIWCTIQDIIIHFFNLPKKKWLSDFEETHIWFAYHTDKYEVTYI